MPYKQFFQTKNKHILRNEHTSPESPAAEATQERLNRILQQNGNRAIQRALRMPRPSEPFELDEQSEKRINQERGRGMPLDEKLQAELSQSMGYDLSQVRVHTSQEADELNQQLSAKAFTTGTDIFFRSGEYNPDNTEGRRLLQHELAHVVQQGTGKVQSGGSGMTVTAPGDQFEKEADRQAESQVSAPQTIQSQEEEEEVQMQTDTEEEEDQG